LLSLGLGVAAYLVLRRPFAAIAEAVAGRFRSLILKRVLAISMTLAAVLGFISVSYRGCGMSYEEIVKDRSYLEQVNRQQLQSASNWIVYAVFAWGGVVVIWLLVLRRDEEGSNPPTH
jgi:4-amino-4-deoxy-L-arabinose transferase-like glycosyltransferase